MERCMATLVFWDGRTDSLWAQAVQPLENPVEMGSDRNFIATTIYEAEDLRRQYETIFGPLPPLSLRSRFPRHARPVTTDPAHPHQRAWMAMAQDDRAEVNRVLTNVTKAIAAFERTIVSRDSPFDHYVAARRSGDPSGGGYLSGSALRGARLFFGRANCFVCHTGSNFTDGEFHNVLSRLPDDPLDPGRYRGILLLQHDPFNSLGAYSDNRHARIGTLVSRLVRTTEQLGQFKTPTLRNIARTAPYMHDGRFATLRDVVRFYSELPGKPPLGHREDFMHPLFLNAQEQAELVAFLESLTDESALPRLRHPVTAPSR
ncbi:MAG: methylamine utilization protein [Candidatus Dadabacteria bacterium]|nr:MAG: methylamine utilization protein [Candidatus Dadabacteria bacterium]